MSRIKEQKLEALLAARPQKSLPGGPQRIALPDQNLFLGIDIPLELAFDPVAERYKAFDSSRVDLAAHVIKLLV